MKHTIIYFIGVYDTLDLFTGKLREAFETMGYASFVYDARLPQSKDALLSVLAESSSPEREFSCVTFNNLGYNLDMEVPAPAQSTGERCVYTKGWDQKCLGILRHPVSQHSDGSSVSL